MNTQEKVKLIRTVAEDMKAESITVMDVAKKTSICEYFVICTGTSDIHVKSISEKIVEKLKSENIRPIRTDDKSQDWYLQDYGDIVVHVMKEETRQFYDLETLWETAETNPDLLD